MARPPDEELSTVETESSSIESAALEPESMDPLIKESDLLDWVARRFQFDPGNRRSPQPMVKTLQRELAKHGEKLAPDGILGRQTIEALNRLGPRLWPVALGAEPASTDFGMGDAAGPTRQERGGKPATESDPTETSANDAAVARPVALSDSAINDASQDRLGFTPYVEAVADFILAEQTQPPLTIAINAPWGHGKTSFMNMLDAQLKHEEAHTTLQVATTWFNPWKYNEPEQVWAALVAKITVCLRKNLNHRQSARFLLRRLGTKLYRLRWDISLWLRVLVAAIFLSLIGCLAFLDLEEVRKAILTEHGLLDTYNKITENEGVGVLWTTIMWLSMALALLLAYVGVANKLGLNLLQYVEQTDFKDKIGTLSQFGHEMEKLREAVPHNLKVVVFIDDLDRCNGTILGELIEALQLAEVSRTCIFVMGMDMHIVARAIEKDRPQLAQSAGGTDRMEHGQGYKFLEKIIQARLTLPAHAPKKIEKLIVDAMPPEESQDGGDRAQDAGSSEAETGEEAQPGPTLIGRLQQRIGLAGKTQRVTPSDSEAVRTTATYYGSRHFSNPRRLKRFINGFRLQTYLTAAVRDVPSSIDRLARFLVLAEKWPAVVAYMLKREMGSEDLLAEKSGGSTGSMAGEIGTLSKDDQGRLRELLVGRDAKDPLSANDWKALADWYGFGHYGSANGG